MGGCPARIPLKQRFFKMPGQDAAVSHISGDNLGHLLQLTSFTSKESLTEVSNLVGGFNPSEKYLSNWIISPGRGENKKYLKPPPSNDQNPQTRDIP